MGWIQDLLQEFPLSAVLKERVALADQKYEGAIKEVELLRQRVEELGKENAALRAQIPNKQESGLSEDAAHVITYLFTAEGNNRDVNAIARALQMEKGMLKFHLECLYEAGLGENAGGNYYLGHAYWTLTQRWSHFLRQPAKVDSPMRRTIQHADAETIFG